MAFGKNLTTTTIPDNLYRKVNDNNFIKDGEHCFSTSLSTKLISHGTFCIVLVKKKYSGVYDSQDADAGKDFGYDEFRVKMTKKELVANIDYIVVPDSWVDSEMDEEDDDYDEEDDPAVWLDNLSEYGLIIPEREAKEKYPYIDFNL